MRRYFLVRTVPVNTINQVILFFLDLIILPNGIFDSSCWFKFDPFTIYEVANNE
jgi:hypothetical protein